MYATLNQLNNLSKAIEGKTLYTEEDVSVKAKNLERINGDLSKFSFVDFMALLNYQEAQVTLTSGLSTLIYELGTAVVGGQTLTATVTKGTSPIAQVEFFRNDVSVSVITTDVADGGNFTYASGTDIVASEKYKVVVTCEDGNTAEDKLEINFYNPYYYGITFQPLTLLTQTDILTMTKDVSKKETKNYTFTSNNEYCIVVYPKEYGLLNSIQDSNGFENVESFSYVELEVNGVPCYVYQTNTKVICTNFSYKFSY